MERMRHLHPFQEHGPLPLIYMQLFAGIECKSGPKPSLAVVEEGEGTQNFWKYRFPPSIKIGVCLSSRNSSKRRLE